MTERCPTCGSAGINERPYTLSGGHPLFVGRQVAACTACGLRYCEPMPSEDDLDDYYASGTYDSGSRRAAGSKQAWSRATLRAQAQCDFVEAVLGGPASSWLDVGAGFGVLLDEAQSRGAVTAGIDPTPIRHDELGQRGHQALASIDEASNAWQVVSSSHVLEHVPDPVAFLKSQEKVLADDGVIFAEVPNILPSWPRTDEPHVLFFTRSPLGATFEKAGLEVVRIQEAGRRSNRYWDQANRVISKVKGTELLPTSLTRYDAEHRYGNGQGRAYLRCAAIRA